MLIAMPWSASTPVKADPVNCEPWSVLEISGLPCFAKASCSVSTQNAASIVIDIRHDRTRRLNQSSTVDLAGARHGGEVPSEAKFQNCNLAYPPQKSPIGDGTPLEPAGP